MPVFGRSTSVHFENAVHSFQLFALTVVLPMVLPTVPSASAQSDAAPIAHTAEDMLTQGDFHGGLIVHLGPTNAEMVIGIAEQRPNALIHCLARTNEQLEWIRNELHNAGRYGQVSAMLWTPPSLPYADGTVNLLLATDEHNAPSEKEINRVLAPRGVARMVRNGRTISDQKPWPDDVDQWSHARHDATGNAVSTDRRVGPPRHLQWEATPRWNRGVKTSGLVSTRGRLFYVLDDSHFNTTDRTWSVIARDAFNGLQLWRRELESWEGARGGKKVGPAQVNRRLVADDRYVYIPLAEDAPVTVLDAATGEVVRTLEATGPVEEFFLADGVLVALSSTTTDAERRRGKPWRMRIAAVDPNTGKLIWEHHPDIVLPMTMASDGEQVVFHDGTAIQSLELATGTPRWTSPPTGQKIEHRNVAHPDSPGAEKQTILLAPQFAPTLIMYDGVVAFAGGRQLNVVSAKDGRELWRSEYAPSNYSVPVDLFGFGGYLWGPDAQMNLWRPLDDNIDYNAFDPLTGETERSVKGDYNFRFQHHRCYQMKVVGETVLASRAGIEFLDTTTGDVAAHHWTRGSCYFGVLPANGLLYTPPHDCACYVRAKLSGFLAMNSKPPLESLVVPEPQRLQRGPAYGATASTPNGSSSGDWPTYRHDIARSGRTTADVDADLAPSWVTKLGGKLTAPVIADGRVYLASTDTHTLFALDAATGDILWQSTFNARIDSPPTVYQGLVLCGCRDGSVHALRAADGELAWRFIAAPEQRMIVVRGQLESAWPVHGSVLVADGVAYFAAGKSSYLDGGLRLYGLDPRTGDRILDRVISSRQEDGSETLDEQGVVGCLNDILSSDGDRLFMRHQPISFDGRLQNERITHLHGADGFLSGDTTNRLLWTYAPMFTSPHQGAFYDLRLSRVLFPSGRILTETDDAIYGFGQIRLTPPITEPGGQWLLFSANKENGTPLDLSAFDYRKLALRGETAIHFNWHKRLPIRVRAMVKTPESLFVAGPLGDLETTQAALDGREPGKLMAVSPSDGKVLAEFPLSSTPAWDGMAAANGSLYLTLANGEVVCLRSNMRDE